MPQPLSMSPHFIAMAHGIRELHLLIAEGKDDSPEADAIRDASDAPWASLSEIERCRIRNLSEDLYSLHEPVPPTLPMDPEAHLKLEEAVEAYRQGEWDKALELIRRWGSYLDPVEVSLFRSAVWREAGDPATAALFHEHGSQLHSENAKDLAIIPHAKVLADDTPARRPVTEVPRQPDGSLPRTQDARSGH